jgi:hypothetical protein
MYIREVNDTNATRRLEMKVFQQNPKVASIKASFA